MNARRRPLAGRLVSWLTEPVGVGALAGVVFALIFLDAVVLWLLGHVGPITN